MPLVHRGLAAVALVSGVVLIAVLPQEMTPAVSAGADAAAVAPLALELGVHTAAGAVAGADRFSRWTGSRLVRVSVELPNGWSPADRLEALRPYAGSGYRLQLTVAARSADGPPVWRALADRLVHLGLATTELRLVPASKPDDAARLRAAATALRSAPGQRFHILFGAVAGRADERAYPGDDYVDGVAVDAGPARPWESVLDGDHGLAWWSTFAAEHHKPFGISRWGGDRERDDPATVDGMVDWIIDPANRVAFATYDDDPASPRCAERYRVRASALAPLAAA